MRLALRIGVLVLLGTAGACSSGDRAGGPADTLRRFYDELNRGDYSAAVACYGADARRVLDDPAIAGTSGFGEWARTETRQGAIDRVEVLNEKSSADTAELSYRVFYRDGSSKNATVTLMREDGVWKLGLIR